MSRMYKELKPLNSRTNRLKLIKHFSNEDVQVANRFAKKSTERQRLT